MTTRASTLTRLTVLFFGLVVLLAGLFVLAWRLDLFSMRDRIAGGRVPDITAWPEASWWPWALGSTCAISAIIALASLIGLSARRGIGTWVMAGANENGELTSDVHAVASATAQSFEKLDGVHKAGYRVRHREGVPTMEISVLCAPSVSLDRLERAALVNGEVLAESFSSPALAQKVFVRTEKLPRDLSSS
ncbi:hypothetical protein [Dietzia sp.]|uniref:hypothetical protein n=1 Tax=Dietzia sp. TaxID=1871616 RepID=UPI002FDABEB9